MQAGRIPTEGFAECPQGQLHGRVEEPGGKLRLRAQPSAHDGGPSFRCQADATIGPAGGGSQQASKSHCP